MYKEDLPSSLHNAGRNIISNNSDLIFGIKDKKPTDLRSKLLEENELLRKELSPESKIQSKISASLNKDSNKLTAQQYLDRWLNEDNVSFSTAFPDIIKREPINKNVNDIRSNAIKKYSTVSTKSSSIQQSVDDQNNFNSIKDVSFSDSKSDVTINDTAKIIPSKNNNYEFSNNGLSPKDINSNNIELHKSIEPPGISQFPYNFNNNPYSSQSNNVLQPIINQPAYPNNYYPPYYNMYQPPNPFLQSMANPFQLPQASIYPSAFQPPIINPYNPIPFISTQSPLIPPNINQQNVIPATNANNSISSQNKPNENESDKDSLLFTLNRDKYKENVSSNQENFSKPSLAEIKHKEELNLLNFQYEKLKKQYEIELLQSENEQAKLLRMHENEHEQWIIEQKQQIEAIKIKEILIKEQKLLDLLENSNNSNFFMPEKGIIPINNMIDNDTNNKLSNSESNNSGYNQLHWEESGCLNQYIPIYLLKNCIVIFDGLTIPKHLQIGLMFRIALGVYDNSGKAVVKLSASDWQTWKKENDNNDSDMIVYLLKPIFKTISLSIDENTRLLFEIQYKNNSSITPNITSPKNVNSNQDSIQSLGWGIMPLVHMIDANSTIDTNKLLNNGMWRVPIRKGLSDPSLNLSTNPISFQSGDIDMLSNDQSYGLIRIINGSEIFKASNWLPKDNNMLKISDINYSYIDLSMINLIHKNEKSNEQITNQLKQAAPNDLNLIPPSRTGIPPSRTGLTSKGDKIIPPSTANRLGFSPRFESENRFNSPTNQIDSKFNSPRFNSPIKSENRFNSPVKSEKLQLALPELKIESIEDSPDILQSIENQNESDNYWLLGNPLPKCNDKFQIGDGIDLYIDSGRYLPDNVTATRIIVKLFTSSKQLVGEIEESYSQMNSISIKPIYNMKVEYRPNNKTIDTSIIALIRIDTIDSTNLSCCCVGYSVIKLFSDINRNKIDINNTSTDVYINTGNFQIPIYSGSPPSNLVQFDDEMLMSLSKIPCASLLLRIYPAPKSIDGFTTLSRNDYPSNDWIKYKLDIPMPNYLERIYYGKLCEPSELELIGFQIKEEINKSTVDVSLDSLYITNTNLPIKPNDIMNQSIEQQISFVRSLFIPNSQIKLFLDYSYILPYHSNIGLSFSIDMIYNIPSDTSTSLSLLTNRFSNNSSILVYEVIYSLLPPGSYYKDPPLISNVNYTKDINFIESNNKIMKYNNVIVSYNPISISSTDQTQSKNTSIHMILDIRIIKITKLNNKTNILVDDKKSYWSIVPLAKQKNKNSDYIYCNSGLIQLPIIQGSVPQTIIQSSNPYNETMSMLKANTLKLLDNTSIIIKIYNSLLYSNIINTITDYTLINTKYMIELLQSSNNINKFDKYLYNNNNVNNNKNLDKQFENLFSNISKDDIIKNINEEFCKFTSLS